MSSLLHSSTEVQRQLAHHQRATILPEGGQPPQSQGGSDGTPASKEKDAHEPVLRAHFSMYKADDALISQLRARAASLGSVASKSAIVRAALRCLAAVPAEDLVRLIDGLDAVATERN